MLTKKDRQAMDSSIPKCECGNNLSRQRQEEGIKICPSCEAKKSPSHIYSGPCPFCGEVIDIEFFYCEEISCGGHGRINIEDHECSQMSTVLCEERN